VWRLYVIVAALLLFGIYALGGIVLRLLVPWVRCGFGVLCGFVARWRRIAGGS
jgi:hypothetical protein